MYSAYKLNKQGANVYSWRTSILILNESMFHIQFYFFLTSIQVSQVAGKVVWYSHLFKNFPQFIVLYTVKGFSIVSEAEVDVFLEFSCFFCDLVDAGSLIFVW